MDNKQILEKIQKELEKHPGDASWSCVECYHGNPCIDKQILKLAANQLYGIMNKENGNV